MALQHLLFALQVGARLEVVRRGVHHDFNPTRLLTLCHLLRAAWPVKAHLRLWAEHLITGLRLLEAACLLKPHHLCKSPVLRHICISAENTAEQVNKREGAKAAARPALGICAHRGSITMEAKAQACRKASPRLSKGIRACSVSALLDLEVMPNHQHRAEAVLTAHQTRTGVRTPPRPNR